MDLSAAFDTVDRSILLKMVEEKFKSKRVAQFIAGLYKGTKTKIWDGCELSREFETNVGVRQGCNLSAFLFNLYMNELPSFLVGGVQVGEKRIRCLMYADDVVLIAESRDQLQMMVNRMVEFCNRRNLVINEQKTKRMNFGEKGRPPKEKVYINRKPIEKVDRYTFLGVVFQSNGGFKYHIKGRIKKGKEAIGAMRKVIDDEKIGGKIKDKIYNATVDKIVLYGAEVHGCEEDSDLDSAERGFYKRMYRLPNNTPNYFFVTELGKKNKCSLRAFEIGLKYLEKIRGMDEKRYPKLVYNALISKDLVPYKDAREGWVELRKRRHRWLELEFGRANGWEDKAGSRLLYQTLEKGDHAEKYEELGCRRAGRIMKVRMEMLNLNYMPYRKNEPYCEGCNEKVREDVVHWLGKCRKWDKERMECFGWLRIGLEEIREICNVSERWKDLESFYERVGERPMP